jgi:hypothetical protein
MPIQCPVCELVNDDMALECAECGRQLLTEGELDATIEPVDGLELTRFDVETAQAPAPETIPELEQTHFAPAQIAMSERVAIEPTILAPAEDVAPDPAPDDFDPGREQDDGLRTPLPEELKACPYCGAAIDGKVCDGCGRRIARYTSAAGEAGGPTLLRRVVAGDDMQFCPACFARIPWGLRCIECGVPLAPRDL